MGLLLSSQALVKSFGSRPLFVDIGLDLHDGDRIGLIGPNGSGKSTLLKMLAGLELPDTGTRALRKGARLGYVAQLDDFPAGATAEEAVIAGLAGERLDPHEQRVQAAIALSKVGFRDPAQRADTLSGGWRKRLALARQLVLRPDVLLLDEPTNHLDLEGILWLEKWLTGAGFAFLMVSHDRVFLERVTRRVIELNRVYPKGYFSAAGNYSDFLAARAEFLAAQSKQQDVLENKVRREIEWLRRGPKARTGKSVGRIQRADQLIDDLAEVSYRNAQQRSVDIDFSSTGRRANQLLRAKGLAQRIGDRTLFSGLDLTLAPGVKIGLIGPNGCGKSTLLGILSGAKQQDAGTIERARDLRVVLFDQHRGQLDQEQTLQRALAFNDDHVMYQDRKMHVVAWAKRFLFQPEQLDVAVRQLSGGEQSRIMIARLMTQPADVLLLDEPTNDLDIPSLEVLEESLQEFTGALVLVTHDRYLLDRVCNLVVALDGAGNAHAYADLAQWEAAAAGRSARDAAEKSAKTNPSSAPRPPRAGKPQRLTHAEQRELEGIEARIHKAEEGLADRERNLTDPAVMADHLRLRACCEELEAGRQAVEALYRRWQELEEKQGRIAN